MKNIEAIIASIDATIAARKQQLPAIQQERQRVSAKLADLDILKNQIDGLLEMKVDEDARQ